MEMRRKDRQLPEEETKVLLRAGEYGVFATVGADGYPYGVPVNYAYDEAENRLIFHGVNEAGMKYENVSRDAKACFTVVGETEVLPGKFSTRYHSVIVFGEASLVEGKEDKTAALMQLVEKYSSAFRPEGRQYAERSWEETAVYQLRIERLTGKARKRR